MEKGMIFEFIAPNSANVSAVCLECINTSDSEFGITNTFLCYGQNRLFTYMIDYISCPVEVEEGVLDYQLCETNPRFGSVVCDYCIIPEYDELLCGL
jgi:hypothetical protein